MSTTSVNVGTERLRRVSPFGAIPLQPALIFAAAGLAIILFALVPATTRIAASQLSGLSIGLIRTVGAGFFSLPLLLVRRARLPRKPNQWGLLLLYAFGNFAGFPILFGVGVRHTSGAHAALIMATMPLLIGLIGMLLERRLPRAIWFVGAAIALGGETALLEMGNSAGSASLSGDAIVFVACTLSAVGIVAGARLGAHVSPLAATLWAITLASASLAPWAAMRLLTAPHAYQDLAAATWTALLQITVGAAVVANMLWLWAVARGGLVRIAPVQFAQPVCALFFACALLNEAPTISLVLVAVDIVLGTVIACRGAKPRAAKREVGFVSAQDQADDIVAASLVPELRGMGASPETVPAHRLAVPAASELELAL